MDAISMNPKELKQRLETLQSKYSELSQELERELTENLLSEDMNNYMLLAYDREMVERQISKVTSLLQSIENINETKKTTRKVEIGSCVKLKNSDHSLDVCIVDAHDAHPQQGMISNVSPVGKAVIGKKKGDAVVVELPNKRIEYTIEEIM